MSVQVILISTVPYTWAAHDEAYLLCKNSHMKLLVHEWDVVKHLLIAHSRNKAGEAVIQNDE
jgi:hypothetical protein